MFGTSSSYLTGSTAGGQTGGGVLGVASLVATIDAVITDSLLPGQTEISYHFYSEAEFDVVNHNGSISCAVILEVLLELDSDSEFSLSQSGDLGGNLSILEHTGTIVGNTMSAGTYVLRHSFGAGAGDTPGRDPSQIQDGTATLLLGPPGTLVPLPSGAGMAFAALGLVALPRKRRLTV